MQKKQTKKKKPRERLSAAASITNSGAASPSQAALTANIGFSGVWIFPADLITIVVSSVSEIASAAA